MAPMTQSIAFDKIMPNGFAGGSTSAPCMYTCMPMRFGAKGITSCQRATLPLLTNGMMSSRLTNNWQPVMPIGVRGSGRGAPSHAVLDSPAIPKGAQNGNHGRFCKSTWRVEPIQGCDPNTAESCGTPAVPEHPEPNGVTVAGVEDVAFLIHVSPKP